MGREVGFPGFDARLTERARSAADGGAPIANVGLATCAEVPGGDEDELLLLEALGATGVAGTTVVWDDPRVDWDGFDLVVVRSAWDYAERRDDFLGWAAGLPRVLNPPPVLTWNTDKECYLTDLAEAGVPVVPTTFVAPGMAFRTPDGPFVVKPSISAGGRSSARFERGDVAKASELVGRIHADGRTAMVQPFLGENAEKALVFLGGRFSHALARRVPLPVSGARPGLYLSEKLAPAEATPTERRIAERALAVAPAEPLYARVDLIGDVVLELEVTEPSLYLGFDAAAPARFAAVIAEAAAKG